MIPADAAEEEIASAQAEMVAAEEIAPPLALITLSTIARRRVHYAVTNDPASLK